MEDGAKKTSRARELPVSSRLAGVLEMAKLDPAGREYPPTAYVFSALGVRLKSVKKAWVTAVLRAHRHEPEWVAGKLSPVSRERLRTIDLHFHDHKGVIVARGSRGCELPSTCQTAPMTSRVERRGRHANLSQTSTYLHSAEMGLQESMRRFDAARGKPVANDPPKEPLPVSHEEPQPPSKDLLH